MFNKERISVFSQEETVRKQVLLIALNIVVIVLFMAVAAFPAEPAAGTTTTTKTSDATTTSLKPGQKLVTLYVSNMACNNCVNYVNKALTGIDGVDKVEISLKGGTAQVVYDTTKVQPEALVAAVTKAGYPTSLVLDKTAATAKAGCPAACGRKESCGSKACKHKVASDSVVVEKGATCDPKTKTCTPGK